MKQLVDLFLIFSRIGAFTFGGGYAMLPIIQKEVVEKRGWATDQEVMDYYAIGQVTPGVIAVNTATFIGYKQRGIAGAIAATLGMIFPSLIIITTIAISFEHFADSEMVQHALAGVRVAVIALIAKIVYDMVQKTATDKLSRALFVIGFICLIMIPISPVWFVMIAAGIGIFAKQRKGAN